MVVLWSPLPLEDPEEVHVNPADVFSSLSVLRGFKDSVEHGPFQHPGGDLLAGSGWTM